MENNESRQSGWNDPRETPHNDDLVGETLRVARMWLAALRRLIEGRGARRTSYTAADTAEYTTESTRGARRGLYRSRSDRMIRGVCAGIADYLGVSPTLVRVLFVLLSLPGFIHGVIAYVLLTVLMREEPRTDYV